MTVTSLKRWGKHWSSLFLAQGCPVCDRPTGKQLGQPFCIDCQRQIPGLHPLSGECFQASAKASLPLQKTVQAWYHDDIHSLPISALGRYQGTLKRAILAMKYDNRPEVAVPLGNALGQQWLNQLSPAHTHKSRAFQPVVPVHTALYAVPIPLHASRQTSRGFNQAELIAQSFCQISGIPLLADGLVRTQSTQPQHQLSLGDREQNLENAFQIGPTLRRLLHRKRPQPEPPQIKLHRTQKGAAMAKNTPSVLLIDDIYTTGTTARSAAQILSSEGIRVIGMLAVARAIID